MKKIVLLIFLISKFTYAHFIQTDKPFDMVAVGAKCYFKLSNEAGEEKYEKSVSMIVDKDGIPLDLYGYFIKGYKLNPSILSIEVEENGKVFSYHKGKSKKQYLSKIELYDKNGKINQKENCFIKQGYVYKI